MRHLLIVLSFILALPAVYADDVTPMDRTYGNPNQQKGGNQRVITTKDGKTTKEVIESGVAAIFDDAERKLISKYYGDHPEYYREYAYKKGTGPGKGNKHKQKGLPPGIAKKLERGGTMPPGIAKQVLPGDLESQLPPVRKGYERRVVGEDVLLVESATGKIADIITEAVLGD